MSNCIPRDSARYAGNKRGPKFTAGAFAWLLRKSQKFKWHPCGYRVKDLKASCSSLIFERGFRACRDGPERKIYETVMNAGCRVASVPSNLGRRVESIRYHYIRSRGANFGDFSVKVPVFSLSRRLLRARRTQITLSKNRLQRKLLHIHKASCVCFNIKLI